MTKAPSGQVVPFGGSARFTITVTNTGDAALTNVVVNDPSAPSCAQTVASLAVGETNSWSCSRAAIAASGTNTITASATSPTGASVTPTPAGSTLSVPYTVGPAGLAIVKTSDAPAGLHPGETFNYTVAVTNTSAITQTGVSITDVLPAGIDYVGPATLAWPKTAPSEDWESSSYAGGQGWRPRADRVRLRYREQLGWR